MRNGRNSEITGQQSFSLSIPREKAVLQPSLDCPGNIIGETKRERENKKQSANSAKVSEKSFLIKTPKLIKTCWAQSWLSANSLVVGHEESEGEGFVLVR